MIESVDFLIKNFSNKRITLNFTDKVYESTFRTNLHDFFEVKDKNTFIILDNLKEVLRTHVYEELFNLRVIDFYAEWCGPCRKVAPEFDTLKSMYPNITFDKIDVDSGNSLIDHCEITNIPAFVVFEGNEIIFKSNSFGKLKEFLNSKVPAKNEIEVLENDISMLELV